MKNKKLTVLAMAAGLSVLSSIPAFAGQWQQDNTGWKYWVWNREYDKNVGHWIDGNNDGIAEFYLFDRNGYMFTNTWVGVKREVIQEGNEETINRYFTALNDPSEADEEENRYYVNANGAWVVDGKVQTQEYDNNWPGIDYPSVQLIGVSFPINTKPSAPVRWNVN